MYFGFKKCRENPDDILFIDSSEHFEKVKTQNILTSENIDKIITTYRDRKAEDKYSYVAPLSEVEENDYNLNIPRYVDTFEEEEPVDIGAAANEIQNVNAELQDNEKTIASFCQELNIKTPF